MVPGHDWLPYNPKPFLLKERGKKRSKLLPLDKTDGFAVFFCLVTVALTGVQRVAVQRLARDVATRVAFVVTGNAVNRVDRV